MRVVLSVIPLVALVIGAMGGGLLTAHLAHTAKAGAQQTAATVNGLRLVDASGAMRAGLDLREDGIVSIRTFAADGTPGGYISTTASGQSFASLSWPGGGPGVYMETNANKGTQISVLASDGDASAVLYVQPKGSPSLFLKDSMNRNRAVLDLTDSGEPRMRFLDVDGNVIWSAP
jgi:hypothetical protein